MPAKEICRANIHFLFHRILSKSFIRKTNSIHDVLQKSSDKRIIWFVSKMVIVKNLQCCLEILHSVEITPWFSTMDISLKFQFLQKRFGQC